MTTIAQIKFARALSDTASTRRHLLLGNGFSIALRHDIFSYASLLGKVDFSTVFEAKQVFGLLKTPDFEAVIRALRTLALVAPPYGGDDNLVEKATSHAEALKEILVKVIAQHHPARPGDISTAQYQACRAFLANFVGDERSDVGGKNRQGHIYTVSYDLLLYWTLLHDSGSASELLHDDGFRASEDDPDAPFVVWDGEGNNEQNIHYLHEALHLFDEGAELRKKCWERSGGYPLMDQIREALDEGMFPLFVAEGETTDKLARIRHHGYLHRALKSFTAVCRSKDAALFVFGHSLADNDAHVFRKIEKGSIPQVYISLYGSPTEGNNPAVLARAKRLKAERLTRGKSLEISWFDAAEVKVWG